MDLEINHSPVFIVGAPRSGTTLLRSILDAHPNICCPTWETGIFDRLAPMFDDLSKDPGGEANLVNVQRSQLVAWMRKSVEDLMQSLKASTTKPRWGEKTPSHVLHINLIHEVFPRAQFVHIIRDGRDVVKSLQNVKWSPRQIQWSVDRWKDCVEAGRSSGAMMPEGLYTEIRYEHITSDPKSAISNLCKFLREEFNPVMLEFHRPENNSWGVQQQAVSAKPVNKGYRQLSWRERMVLNKRAGKLLNELGYT